MRSLLLHPDRDFEPAPALRDEVFAAMLSGSVTEVAKVKQEYGRGHSGAEPPLPPIPTMLVDDLELATLWNTMSGGDEFVYETVRRVVLSSVSEPAVIRYRQAILSDCLTHPDLVAQLYDLTLNALRNVRRAGNAYTGAGPAYLLTRNITLLHQHIASLRRLRTLIASQAPAFRSAGLRQLAERVARDLNEEYLSRLEATLDELAFAGGIVATAGLGADDETDAFVVHPPPARVLPGWGSRLHVRRETSSLTSFEVDQTDEDSTQELQWLRGKALARISATAASAAEHIKHFLAALRLELAFYIGAINLKSALARRSTPLCFPEPLPADRLVLSAQDLREPCLILRSQRPISGGDLAADGKALIVITGANEGGKSTALRSVGVAQLMLQCGLYVAAREYHGSVQHGLYTHYRRQEDVGLDAGKLEEELSRMQAITDEIAPGALLLCNESFAATNEREGSEIARQVVSALLDRGVRVICVTHMYEFAHHFHDEQRPDALFLRPERGPDGRRTFRLLEGEPLPISFGQDSFERIFGQAPLTPRGPG